VEFQRGTGNHNRGAAEGVGEAIVAKKRSNVGGARGLQNRCGVRGKESRLAETHTTEDGQGGNTLPENSLCLRQKLGQKAKQEPKFRFYALYDRIYRTMCWKRRWRECGTIAERREWTESLGADKKRKRWHGEIRSNCARNFAQRATGRRRCGGVHPEANGKLRPAGIPAIRDRVAQMAGC